MTDSGTAEPPVDAAEPAAPSPPTTVPVEAMPVPVYLLVEPMVQNKKVLDIGPTGGGPRAQILRRAGAAEVVTCSPEGLRVPVSDGIADVVLCSLSADLVASSHRRSVWLAEIHRLVKPDGFCALHIPTAALQRQGRGSQGPLSACTDMLLAFFATVDVVEQTQFVGLSFHVPGTDDLAVNESLTRLSGTADHIVAFCAHGDERAWSLTESLLVPIGGGAINRESPPGELMAWQAEVARLEARCAELSHERDSTREERMTLQDRADRLERTVAALRKEVERTLRQMSNDNAARELLILERNELRRKLDEVTQQANEVSRLAEKRQVALRALEKEVARLRAARGHGR